MALTPAKYWRVSCPLDAQVPAPSGEFILPGALYKQTKPPLKGHGIVIAAYDESRNRGLFRWVGLITGGKAEVRDVVWVPSSTEIFVDTETGSGYWRSGSFGFASNKSTDYDLHAIWKQHFPPLELRA